MKIKLKTELDYEILMNSRGNVPQAILYLSCLKENMPGNTDRRAFLIS